MAYVHFPKMILKSNSIRIIYCWTLIQSALSGVDLMDLRDKSTVWIMISGLLLYALIICLEGRHSPNAQEATVPQQPHKNKQKKPVILFSKHRRKQLNLLNNQKSSKRWCKVQLTSYSFLKSEVIINSQSKNGNFAGKITI